MDLLIQLLIHGSLGVTFLCRQQKVREWSFKLYVLNSSLRQFHKACIFVHGNGMMHITRSWIRLPKCSIFKWVRFGLNLGSWLL